MLTCRKGKHTKDEPEDDGIKDEAEDDPMLEVKKDESDDDDAEPPANEVDQEEAEHPWHTLPFGESLLDSYFKPALFWLHLLVVLQHLVV